MKKLSSPLLLSILGLVQPLQGQSVCRSADSTSAALIRDVGRYSSATAGDDKTMRDSLRLPLTSPSQVVLVTTSSICQKANTAYQTAVSASGGTGLSGRVYVVKVGQTYAVLDPNYNAGQPGSWSVVIFDSKFRELSSY
jgi:hypothetical protein